MKKPYYITHFWPLFCCVPICFSPLLQADETFPKLNVFWYHPATSNSTESTQRQQIHGDEWMIALPDSRAIDSSTTTDSSQTINTTPTIVFETQGNGAVDRVDFFINGQLVLSDREAPYQMAAELIDPKHWRLKQSPQ